MFDSAAIDDLNGDGIPDVAIASKRVGDEPPHPGQVLVKTQDLLSPGTFSSAVKFRVGHSPLAVAAGDINGDGLTDLVTANSSDDNISVLLQNPAMPGNFPAATNFLTGNYPNDLAIGDLDGDGLVDIAIADNGLSVLFQDPASIGSFLPRASLGVGSGSVAIGDLDGDLLADLAATSADRGVVMVLLQDPAASGTFLPAVEYTAGDQPVHVAIGDIDGDTLPDLAVANLGEPDGGGNRGVSVLLQDQTAPGNFLPATDYIMGDSVHEVAIGDLNDDGRSDLAAAGENLGGGTWDWARVYVLFQDPDIPPGSFFPPVSYKLDGVGTSSVAIGDLNEDTFNDILAATSEKVYILFQDSANPGTFLPQVIQKR